MPGARRQGFLAGSVGSVLASFQIGGGETRARRMAYLCPFADARLGPAPRRREVRGSVPELLAFTTSIRMELIH